MQTNNVTDLLIIGGGINGCGIAADAAGRGLSVVLCEQNDLANATSSSSSKLIHGGLRYLEHYEFRLVREALAEREILLNKAPHIIRPIEFIIPHHHDLRPAWLIRLGLFLYDHLGFRKQLPKSRKITLKNHPAGAPLKSNFKVGFSYADCQVDDARLVVLNAIAAKEKGAKVLTYHKVLSAKRNNTFWEVQVQKQSNDEKFFFYAKALINAAGPWVSEMLQNFNLPTTKKVKLIKGSHIVVNKLYSGDHGYVLQNSDQRVIFIVPFEENYSLIGTTDLLHDDKPGHVQINEEEKSYLCDLVNGFFKKPITLTDIVWSYAGLRPLLNDETDNVSAITRDYSFEINDIDQLPLLTIFGGKITTYRKLAESALKLLKPYFSDSIISWTRKASLPGGEIPDTNFHSFYQDICKQYSWLPEQLASRYAKSYGTRIHHLLENTSTITDLGELFGENLYQKEVDYLIENEWARNADDILWRRSKLGLNFLNKDIVSLNTYCNDFLRKIDSEK